MTEKRHTELAAGRWYELTLAEQLGNIGSEVHRAASAQGARADDFKLAFERTLELIDLTLNDPRHRGRLKEIARLRELFCGAAAGESALKTSIEDLDGYLMQFAVLARQGK